MATYRAGALVVAALAVSLFGCASMLERSRAVARQHWKWRVPRQLYIRRSRVWLGSDLESWLQHMRTLDLLAGPHIDPQFGLEELVRCELTPPHGTKTGNTPKFFCRPAAGSDESFKVKWGESNGEVFAEVAASRLFWALGFGADRDDPVRVECSGCAADPWRDRTRHPDNAPVFAPAMLERPFPGETIEEFDDQGWTWSELDQIDPTAGGSPRAQVDALKLLAAFVQHRDSKASNQRLVCRPDGLIQPVDGAWDCNTPFLIIQDLGETFGGPKAFGLHTQKMTLDAWRHEPVWTDPERCIANVTGEYDAFHGLVHPHIGEAGRRFLAALLSGLDDRQLTALFTAARADRRGGIAEWVAAFKARREQVVHPLKDADFRCPTG